MTKKQTIDLVGFGFAVYIHNLCEEKDVRLSDAEIDQLMDAIARSLKSFRPLLGGAWLAPNVAQWLEPDGEV